MRVVNQAIEDCVGICWIADDLMPGSHRELVGDNGGAATVAIFEDFQEIMTGLVVEWLKAPIVQYQELDVTKGALKPGIAAVTMSQGEVGVQARHALIENRPIIAAGFMPECTGQPTFANAGRSADREIIVGIDPVAADQLHEWRPVESALAAVVDILWYL